jgi:hypothetical protein
MKVIIYFDHNRHTDDHFEVYACTDSNVQEIEKKIAEWAAGFFGEDLVEGQPINNPSISMHYDFAMGSEDYCRGYFIKNIED